MAGDTPGTIRGAGPGTMGGPPGQPSATGGGCFGGYWRGMTDAAGLRRNVHLRLKQSGNTLSGTLELRGYEGSEGVQQLSGTANCAAETATLTVTSTTEESRDINAQVYSLKLVKTPGYPLRFEGTFTCKDSDCPGETSGELQQ